MSSMFVLSPASTLRAHPFQKRNQGGTAQAPVRRSYWESDPIPSSSSILQGLEAFSTLSHEVPAVLRPSLPGSPEVCKHMHPPGIIPSMDISDAKLATAPSTPYLTPNGGLSPTEGSSAVFNSPTHSLSSVEVCSEPQPEPTPAQGQPPQIPQFAIKLLVSNSMAGTLIGKGGIRISKLKQECTVDIKVTPNGRYFPGTHDRVVLLIGTPPNLQSACGRILDTVHSEAAEGNTRLSQRILVPDATGGLIIGRDGMRISDMRDAAGLTNVQVSTRELSAVSGERLVTLQGPLEALKLGIGVVVERFQEDPAASKYENMSTMYRIPRDTDSKSSDGSSRPLIGPVGKGPGASLAALRALQDAKEKEKEKEAGKA